MYLEERADLWVYEENLRVSKFNEENLWFYEEQCIEANLWP